MNEYNLEIFFYLIIILVMISFIYYMETYPLNKDFYIPDQNCPYQNYKLNNETIRNTFHNRSID